MHRIVIAALLPQGHFGRDGAAISEVAPMSLSAARFLFTYAPRRHGFVVALRRVGGVLVVCLAMLIPDAFAQSAAVIKQGEAVCAEAARAINVLADFTSTVCTPAKGEGGKITLIFISKHRVFDNAQRKRAYLAYLTAAAGSSLNKRASLSVDWVTAMDPELGEKRQFWRMAAGDARTLQKQVHDGSLGAEAFLVALEAKGSLQPVDKARK